VGFVFNMAKFKTQYDKRPVKNGIFPCDEFLPGDGLDPRYDKNHTGKVANRKAMQLCSQVRDSLNLSEAMRDLYVESVIPAPDSTQLLVTVITENDVDSTTRNLNNAIGFLRSEVASYINRKRVPNIKFNIVKK
jgi:ribosome-binding factor A